MYGQREVIISSLQLLLAYLAQSQWGASQFSSVQSLSRVRLFATPWDCSASGFPVHHQLQSLLKIMSIESVILFNYLIFCHPLLLLPSISPSIRVFSNELVLRIRWPKYWSLGEGNSTPLQYSCLENPMDGGAWWATVHSVTKSWT